MRILLIIFLFPSLLSFGQSQLDFLYLKNGDFIRGNIIEQTFGESITVIINKRDTVIIKEDSIEKIESIRNVNNETIKLAGSIMKLRNDRAKGLAGYLTFGLPSPMSISFAGGYEIINALQVLLGYSFDYDGYNDNRFNIIFLHVGGDLGTYKITPVYGVDVGLGFSDDVNDNSWWGWNTTNSTSAFGYLRCSFGMKVYGAGDVAYLLRTNFTYNAGNYAEQWNSLEENIANSFSISTGIAF